MLIQIIRLKKNNTAGNLDPYKGTKNSRNSKYLDKYKTLFLTFKFYLKDNYFKQKEIVFYDIYRTTICQL